MGKSADPEALAAYRAKLDAYLSTEMETPYFQQAKARLTDVIHTRDAQFSWGRATLLYDDPAKITRAPGDAEGHLMSQFRALDLKPEREMLIVSPYFVPQK